MGVINWRTRKHFVKGCLSVQKRGPFKNFEVWKGFPWKLYQANFRPMPLKKSIWYSVLSAKVLYNDVVVRRTRTRSETNSYFFSTSFWSNLSNLLFCPIQDLRKKGVIEFKIDQQNKNGVIGEMTVSLKMGPIDRHMLRVHRWSAPRRVCLRVWGWFFFCIRPFHYKCLWTVPKFFNVHLFSAFLLAMKLQNRFT